MNSIVFVICVDMFAHIHVCMNEHVDIFLSLIKWSWNTNYSCSTSQVSRLFVPWQRHDIYLQSVFACAVMPHTVSLSLHTYDKSRLSTCYGPRGRMHQCKWEELRRPRVSTQTWRQSRETWRGVDSAAAVLAIVQVIYTQGLEGSPPRRAEQRGEERGRNGAWEKGGGVSERGASKPLSHWAGRREGEKSHSGW